MKRQITTQFETEKTKVFQINKDGTFTKVVNQDNSTKEINYTLWVINYTDENGNKLEHVLDSRGAIIEIKEFNKDEVYVTTYDYDVLRNLVGIVDDFRNVWNFSYDSLGRKVGEVDPDLGEISYSYDLNGNLISENRSHGGLVSDGEFVREYDELGQLVNVSLLNGSLVESYVYDGNGDRIKSYNYLTDTTTYTPFKEFMQIRNSSGIYNFTYVYEGSVLVSRINPDGSKWFYHPDHLGSTTLITDEAGNLIEDNWYLPYGGLGSNESWERKLYEGMEYSDDLGEYDYEFRQYSPSKRIFLKADNILPDIYDPQQLNRYWFERGNPYSYTDPEGHAISPYHFFGTFTAAYSKGYSFKSSIQMARGSVIPDVMKNYNRPGPGKISANIDRALLLISTSKESKRNLEWTDYHGYSGDNKVNYINKLKNEISQNIAKSDFAGAGIALHAIQDQEVHERDKESYGIIKHILLVDSTPEAAKDSFVQARKSLPSPKGDSRNLFRKSHDFFSGLFGGKN